LIGAFVRGALIGCVGVERHGSQALLRSLAVEEGQRGVGVGSTLVEAALERASDGGMREAFCVTMDTADYLSRLGFETIERNEIAGPVTDAMQLRGVCPETASVLWRVLPR
jgi:N-acetylglutamate synthase-like GNAT family acetyltransferase